MEGTKSASGAVSNARNCSAFGFKKGLVTKMGQSGEMEPRQEGSPAPRVHGSEPAEDALGEKRRSWRDELSRTAPGDPMRRLSYCARGARPTGCQET
jgi:hypothetical protein